MSSFVTYTLSNGLRLCLEPVDHVPSAACGFLVRTGSRDEQPAEAGVSHFLEHMCFKGTARTSCVEINQRFDRLGSKHNAFTSQEKTMYYGWVPAANLGPQLELLAEMMRSTLPQAEFETEKQVILEEIAMYRDSLQSCMFELASQELFRGTPLAHSVLGTPETIGPLTRAQMVDYHARRYGPENLIFVASGRLEPTAVRDLVEACCADWPRATGGRTQPAPRLTNGVAKQRHEKFKQQALMLCFPAPAAAEDDARVSALARILGGENSRIYWNVIQRGVCANAGAFYMSYSDIGVFVLYAVCEPERAGAALDALRAEAARIQRSGAEPEEVQRVANTMRTNAARDGDAPMRRLMQLANDIDVLGEPRTIEQQLARIEAVTAADLRALLASFPISGEGMLVSVGPADWPL
ncbi:MAG: insulinase family protein [Proteobacteria bacterium]|nr:insulinase family protein [Pseudomonadota bacterium]